MATDVFGVNACRTECNTIPIECVYGVGEVFVFDAYNCGTIVFFRHILKDVPEGGDLLETYLNELYLEAPRLSPVLESW